MGFGSQKPLEAEQQGVPLVEPFSLHRGVDTLQLWSQNSGSGRILMHPSIQQDISEDTLCASLRVRCGTPRDVRQPRKPRRCFVSAVRAPMAAYELLVQVVFTAGE